MLEPILDISAFLAAAGEGQADGLGGDLLEGGAIERGLSAIVQLALWFDLFESRELNHALNLALGIVEALGGTILISGGLRQFDFGNASGGEELRRMRRRTAGEAVKTLLGHFLRLVGIVRSLASVFLMVGNLL